MVTIHYHDGSVTHHDLYNFPYLVRNVLDYAHFNSMLIDVVAIEAVSGDCIWGWRK